MKSSFVLIAVVAALTACGGGGGGGGGASTPAPQEPAIQSTAGVSYAATNLPAGGVYDPWTPIRLEPTISGLPGTAVKSFRLTSALPAGLTMDPATGVITGLVDNVDANLVSATVAMSAQGYSGEIPVTSPQVRVNGLTSITAVGGGFTLGGNVIGPTITGHVGVSGTVSAMPVMKSFMPDGTRAIGGALPAGATVVYGLTTRSTMPGGVMDPATGVYQWAPDRTGNFSLDWYADVTFNGVTRRVLGNSIPFLFIVN